MRKELMVGSSDDYSGETVYPISNPNSVVSGLRSLTELRKESMLDYIRLRKPEVKSFYSEERVLAMALVELKLIKIVEACYKVVSPSR